MATRFIDHLLEGDHASRPAFGDVPQGTLYACSTHALIYQSDGATAWATWATLGGTVADILDLDTAETDDTLVLAPDGAGGVEFRAEAGGAADISVRVTRSAAYNLPTSTTAVPWDNQVYDTDSMWEGVTNPSRITFTTAGKYHVGCQVGHGNSNNNDLWVSIRLNGTTEIAKLNVVQSEDSSPKSVNLGIDYQFAATDYIEVLTLSSGGAVAAALNLMSAWAHKFG